MIVAKKDRMSSLENEMGVIVVTGQKALDLITQILQHLRAIKQDSQLRNTHSTLCRTEHENMSG
jgi:hypothetical protein